MCNRSELSCKDETIAFLFSISIIASMLKTNILYYTVVVVAVVDLLSYVHGKPGRVAQSIGHLTRKSGVLGSIPGLATYFRFSFLFFKKGSCQLLAKVCARSTG